MNVKCNELAEDAKCLGELVSSLQNWVLSQNLRRCNIAIAGQLYQFDALYGLSTLKDPDLPELMCPYAQQLEQFLPAKD